MTTTFYEQTRLCVTEPRGVKMNAFSNKLRNRQKLILYTYFTNPCGVL